MKALVTGGAGFIGSNLVDALVERGHEAAVIDDLSSGRRENLRDPLANGLILHEEDVRNGDRVIEIMNRERPDVVFHLAAQTRVRRSVEDPWRDAAINIGGTITVLEAARRSDVRRVVNASTGGAIYGDAEKVPISESAPVQPISPYGRSKHAAEGYCELYSHLYGLSAVSLRYANVFGPRQDASGEGGVISTYAGKLLSGGTPHVYGDGTQTRDYTYVGDVVRATLAAAESDAPGPFNVGRGEQTSVLALVEAFRAYSRDHAFEPEFLPARPAEVRTSCLDPSRACEVLGWKATVDLHEGIARTLASLEASVSAR